MYPSFLSLILFCLVPPSRGFVGAPVWGGVVDRVSCRVARTVERSVGLHVHFVPFSW